ncbi:hypothetical protein NCCP2331_14340 [Sporosarcina sp. NCCP-2331]|nr:hypothetical protein NCCP2331_14340 [Sporosarcina sp. NCCP-2331]GLB55405.1 hypothetical protein NCCP2378_11920 [Sporosarcina sp. NCCP-2378]
MHKEIKEARTDNIHNSTNKQREKADEKRGVDIIEQGQLIKEYPNRNKNYYLGDKKNNNSRFHINPSFLL